MDNLAEQCCKMSKYFTEEEWERTENILKEKTGRTAVLHFLLKVADRLEEIRLALDIERKV